MRPKQYVKKVFGILVGEKENRGEVPHHQDYLHLLEHLYQEKQLNQSQENVLVEDANVEVAIEEEEGDNETKNYTKKKVDS